MMDKSQLPRSIRWRIQLGIYKLPEDPPDEGLVGDENELLEWIYQQNKDLIPEYQERFRRLMEQHIELEELEEEHPNDDQDCHPPTELLQSPGAVVLPAAAEMDPLTAMVLEQEAENARKAQLLLKYKKERARRKRGLTVEGKEMTDESEGIDRASLVIIEKDLKRLPHPTSNNGAATGNLTPEEKERIHNLKEILYLYAQEHPKMGYRQGMHEVASYLMYVLEIEQPQYPNNPHYQDVLSICFALLEHTLDQLQLAYDASGEKALQRMSNSILSKVHQNDPTLFHHLSTSPNIPPPPIYCTRWVRLLFSREVVGFENVFLLWDAFFDYYPNIMRALEMASSARILLLRNELLNPERNSLDLLMNVPPQTDITPLTTLMKQLMEQKEPDSPISIPPSMMLSAPPPPLLPPPKAPDIPPPTATPQIFRFPSGEAKTSLPNGATNHPLHNHNNTFSFSKMKVSLGKKSESIRKKIVTATNEWKRENSNGSSSNYSVPSDIFASASDAIRRSNPTEHVSFSPTDPLRNPSSPQHQHHHPLPPSPLKHQHARWAQGLHERILVLQNYLMSIEEASNSNAVSSEESMEGKVPAQVWEAMADMQRMQQELYNYSVHMP